jgi:3-hydroxyacyl-CoA dehydrogenase/enoyl-CoA hydratase/3-hydroxybutyryl-CoA epimerase
MKLINTMVDDHGRLGRKNGKGFYDYPAKPAKKKLWPGLKDLYKQRNPDKIDVEELKQRFLVVIALEAARVMEEGIVTDPREADVGSILAFGFAPYTGGTLSYIDGMGAAKFVKLAKSLQKKYGAEFKAPKLLINMAEKGETFYQRFDPYVGCNVHQSLQMSDHRSMRPRSSACHGSARCAVHLVKNRSASLQ